VITDMRATWSISLDTDCPECSQSIDLIDCEHFLESGILPLETSTERANNVKVTCVCGHEFTVELEC
jgi:hypothetical protein